MSPMREGGWTMFQNETRVMDLLKFKLRSADQYIGCEPFVERPPG
jgi:hypothetical protein